MLRKSWVIRKKEVVIDPNETWREFVSSVIGFEDPKTVPVDSLPEDFNPSNRKFERFKSLINWRNKNYIENWKKEKSEEEQYTDIEQNKIMKGDNEIMNQTI